MTTQTFPADVSGVTLYFVGIKGTGMSALADLCHRKGAAVSGSDTEEVFSTDALLRDAGIPVSEGFDEANLAADADWVVYSGAYDPDRHPELVAARTRGMPLIEYSSVLGVMSAATSTAGIAGIHGKTTTTGIAGTVLDRIGIGVSVLAGTAVPTFGGRSVLYRGDRYFVVESDEYRRHFLALRPERAVVTSIELDHPDYFADTEDVLRAFIEFVDLLPERGELVFCADDPGAARLAEHTARRRGDLTLIPYGRTAGGAFGVTGEESAAGATTFVVGCLPEVARIHVPGAHNVLNAAATVALADSICRDDHGEFTDADAAACLEGLASYRGSTRRCEIVGEWRGAIVVDDYGHHPTAVQTTIAGLKAFYPGRRIVVDFMPHTYSRTEALLDEFSRCFDDADVVVLHPVYASARERSGAVGGVDLYRAVEERRRDVYYFEDFSETVRFLEPIVGSGDVFLTIGAGDNWKVGRMLMER